MVSRYYMAGLRLPTIIDGKSAITPEAKGMWVTGDSPGNYQLPAFAGIYALTGQQFPIPTLNQTDPFIITFEKTVHDLTWLNFLGKDGEDSTQLQITIQPGETEAEAIQAVYDFATQNRLNTGLTALGLGSMFNTQAATYTFNSEIDWNAVSSFTMPYGGIPSGTIPAMQLWRLPDALLALPDPATRQVTPPHGDEGGRIQRSRQGHGRPGPQLLRLRFPGGVHR